MVKVSAPGGVRTIPTDMPTFSAPLVLVRGAGSKYRSLAV